MYAVAMLDRPQRYGPCAAARSLEDLQLLIKEHELITGSAGRSFVLVLNGLTRVLHVSFDGTAYGVREGSCSSCPQWRLEDELLRSAFGAALRAGQVFTLEAE